MNISPIFYMGNKKKLIKKGLVELFPKNINTFIDVFGGSGIVSMNTQASNYIINDIDKNLVLFYNLFKKETAEFIIENILNNINNFGLTRNRTEQNTPEAEKFKKCYFKLRDKANQTKNIIDLYTCIFYAFSQQMRFNKKGEFNMPFGNRAFSEINEEYIQNGCDFFGASNVEITNKNFTDLILDLQKNDFVYLDSPYLNTTATYNDNWNETHEELLYELMEQLMSKGIKFGLSNVFENKGIVNKKLIQWCEKNQLQVHYFNDFNYYACGKGNGKTVEVYITNYKGE